MLQIVEATETDAEYVADIIQAAFRKQAEILGIQRADYPNYVAFEEPDSVRKRMEKGDKVFLGCRGAEPIATVSCRVSESGRRGEVKKLAVLPEFRGRGHGEKLMSCAEMKLEELGVEETELAIVASFHRLRTYYEGLGYLAGETKTYPSLPFDVLFLRKLIKKAPTDEPISALFRRT